MDLRIGPCYILQLVLKLIPIHNATVITLIAMVFANALCSGLETSKLIVAFQAPWNSSYPFSASKLGSGIQIAIDKVNSYPSYLGNYSLDFVYADCGCDAKKSVNAFINQVQKENISALFGPVCSEAAEVEYDFLPLSLSWPCCSVYCVYFCFLCELTNSGSCV